MVFAAILTLPVFVLEMGAHLIPAFHMAIERSIGTQTSWLIQFVLATIVLFGPGLAFFTKGVPALLRGAPDMNSLVAVGTGAAWVYSVVATFLPALRRTLARGAGEGPHRRGDPGAAGPTGSHGARPARQRDGRGGC